MWMRVLPWRCVVLLKWDLGSFFVDWAHAPNASTQIDANINQQRTPTKSLLLLLYWHQDNHRQSGDLDRHNRTDISCHPFSVKVSSTNAHCTISYLKDFEYDDCQVIHHPRNYLAGSMLGFPNDDALVCTSQTSGRFLSTPTTLKSIENGRR